MTSLQYGGIDIINYGAILAEQFTFRTPAVRPYRVAIPGRNGLYEWPSDLGERTLDLDLVVDGAGSEATYETYADALSALFEPTGLTKQLIFDHQNDRYYLARSTGPIEFVMRMLSWSLAHVPLICSDPLGYAIAQSIPSSGASPLAVTPAGSYKTYPTLEITASGAFTGNVVFTNAATAEALTWNGTLAIGDILKVETDTMRVRKNGVLAMSGLVTNSVFFPLYVGLSNSISVAGPAISLLKATYRARWL